MIGRQELREFGSSSGNAAPYRADGAFADLCRFLVSETSGAYQYDSLAPFRRELLQRCIHVGEMHPCLLLGRSDEQVPPGGGAPPGSATR